jgi:hypothetical protein
MSSTTKSLISFAIVVLLVFVMVLPVFAAPEACSGDTCLKNPLRFPTLERFIEGVLQAVVMIALPIIVGFMVFAGFKYIFAQGNQNKITEAHKNFTWVVIGTILILSAWVLATLIGATVTQLLR